MRYLFHHFHALFSGRLSYLSILAQVIRRYSSRRTRLEVETGVDIKELAIVIFAFIFHVQTFEEAFGSILLSQYGVRRKG